MITVSGGDREIARGSWMLRIAGRQRTREREAPVLVGPEELLGQIDQHKLRLAGGVPIAFGHRREVADVAEPPRNLQAGAGDGVAPIDAVESQDVHPAAAEKTLDVLAGREHAAAP